MDIAIRVKKALHDKGWTQKKLCQELDITETGFKYTVDNNSWKVETLDRIAGILNLPIMYFLTDNEENLYQFQKTSSNETTIKEIKVLFEEELREKNQLIANLVKTVDMLAGKSEGGTLMPLLSTGDPVFDKHIRSTEPQDLRSVLLHQNQSNQVSESKSWWHPVLKA